MKLKLKISIQKLSLEKSLGLLLLLYIIIQTMEIPYIKRYIGFTWSAIFYLFAAAIALTVYMGKGVKKDAEIFLFGLFIIIVGIVSIFNNGSITYLVGMFAPLIIVASLFMCCHSEQEKLNVISVLEVFYTILLMIDIITMILYPNGLYSDELYTTYWFLGYKTQRMVYIFPLLIFRAYKGKFKGKKQLKSLILLIAMVLLVLWKADNKSSIVGVVFFLCMTIIISMVGTENQVRKGLVCVLTDFRLFFAIYVVLFIIFVIYQNMTFVSDFFINVLDRTITFSGRTRIWINCLDYVSLKPIFGHGILTTNQYIKVTGMQAGSNAHNLILTYLVSSGIVGTGIFFLFNFFISRRSKRGISELILIAGIYSILITGISSSVLAFSPALFGIYFLLLSGREQNADKTL